MINTRATGLDGSAYAMDLLERGGVAVMPGTSFGSTVNDWVRVALTISDTAFETAIDRIVAHAETLRCEAA